MTSQTTITPPAADTRTIPKAKRACHHLPTTRDLVLIVPTTDSDIHLRLLSDLRIQQQVIISNPAGCWALDYGGVDTCERHVLSIIGPWDLATAPKPNITVFLHPYRRLIVAGDAKVHLGTDTAEPAMLGVVLGGGARVADKKTNGPDR